MINNCPRCNKHPRVNVTVKCVNNKCTEFGEEYYVYEWQALKKNNQGDINISAESLMAQYSAL